ncbi:MAG TPA: hypothetical protein VMG81_03945 [Thermoplasmata archaeon]|nr:hypothetical protein [Thermoplasmata archaeon]
MTAVSVLHAFFTDPTFDLPLAVLAIAGALLVVWSVRRTRPLPRTEPTPSRPPWSERPDSWAYGAFLEGRYFPAADAIAKQLAATLQQRYGVRIDRREDLARADLDRRLPAPLTVRGLVQSVQTAYWAAARVEAPSWLESHWTWLRQYRERQSEDAFRLAIEDLQRAAPLWEAG